MEATMGSDLLGFLSAAMLGAQLLYGGLVGTITDSQGAMVPGAKVVIVNTDTNLTRETTTDSQGGFTFVNVLAGPYDVKVTLDGFRDSVRTGVPVSVGQISRANLVLEVGTMNEGITVRSEAKLLQTDRADEHPELRTTELTNRPL